MMFELSEDHEAFRKVVRDFAERELAPHVARWDEEHHFPVEAVLAMGELGLFGLVFPEEWGGGGGNFASLCVAIEEIGRIDQSLGITLSAGVGLGANPIYRFGDDEQKQRWLPDLIAGRALGASASPSPAVAATPVPPPREPAARATTGCWTGPRPSSPTAVHRSRRSSR